MAAERCYAIRRAGALAQDAAAIKAHLIAAYREFGEARAAATSQANARLQGAFDYIQSLSRYPHRGTLHPGLRGRVRHVTHLGFIFYFDVDDTSAEVTVLALFFSGQDHLRQLTERLKRVASVPTPSNNQP